MADIMLTCFLNSEKIPTLLPESSKWQLLPSAFQYNLRSPIFKLSNQTNTIIIMNYALH